MSRRPVVGNELYNSVLWKNLSNFVRFERARGYCEECGVSHGTIAPDWRSVVFLHCAHLNGDRSDLRLSNLRALCPRCHLRHDEGQRARGRAERAGGHGALLVSAARRVLGRFPAAVPRPHT